MEPENVQTGMKVRITPEGQKQPDNRIYKIKAVRKMQNGKTMAWVYGKALPVDVRRLVKFTQRSVAAA